MSSSPMGKQAFARQISLFDEGGDDGLVKDGGYREGAGGFPLPEYLQARPYLHHERIQTLGRLVA